MSSNQSVWQTASIASRPSTGSYQGCLQQNRHVTRIMAICSRCVASYRAICLAGQVPGQLLEPQKPDMQSKHRSCIPAITCTLRTRATIHPLIRNMQNKRNPQRRRPSHLYIKLLVQMSGNEYVVAWRLPSYDHGASINIAIFPSPLLSQALGSVSAVSNLVRMSSLTMSVTQYRIHPNLHVAVLTLPFYTLGRTIPRLSTAIAALSPLQTSSALVTSSGVTLERIDAGRPPVRGRHCSEEDRYVVYCHQKRGEVARYSDTSTDSS